MAGNRSAKFAKGECARSGQKMYLKDMVPDGHIKGLLVHPDWFEPEHPQEKIKIFRDRFSLDHPMPKRDQNVHTVTLPVFDIENGRTMGSTLGSSLNNVGEVTTS